MDLDIAVTHQLPVIDLDGLGNDRREHEIGCALDHAFRTIGFCYIANTGIDRTLLDGVFLASRRFHAMPDEAKSAVAINRFHRGYIAARTQVFKSSSVAQVKRPNLSESFMLMHEVPPDDTRFGTPLNGPNQWPAGAPEFREAIQAYDTAMHELCLRLLRPLARALDLRPDALTPFFRHPTTFLRLLHYPPQPPDAPDDLFGAAPHTDYGFITILAQDNSGGLEVRARDGDWIPAPPIPDTFVVNVADMVARWTNDRWQSTPHRVRNLSGGDRYSCPYFFDMDLDATVACLESCCDPNDPPRYEPVRYDDYLLDRLDRNYSYRQSAT
ncbi:MAG TPA: 2-oxoglutarate and iron-dependent oxygenase domain-containing protein [Acetobacteraceae bacterium]